MQINPVGKEGVSLDLVDIEPCEAKADVAGLDGSSELAAMQHEWDAGHLSAYRAAYLKTHGWVVQQ